MAAHTGAVPVEDLYRWCRLARGEVLTGEHRVGRVIARPFEGEPGHFERLSHDRRDYSLAPPEPNLLSLLKEAGIRRYSIGKISDLFGEDYFTQYRKTRGNAEGLSQMLSLMSAAEDSFVFVNLIDTDQKYGHRLDPEGSASCLQELDRAVPAMFSKLREGDLFISTGDHGNDPTHRQHGPQPRVRPSPGLPGSTFRPGDEGNVQRRGMQRGPFLRAGTFLPRTGFLKSHKS
ncbi:MAG: hypothetical protein U5K31_12620 [Balneolaceae bacterium]|nr:hypothetical protein [Balneolaceae bacterium]